MVLPKLIHQIFLPLLEFGVEGVRTVREAAHSLVHQVIWESLSLLADVAGNGRHLLLIWRHEFVRIDELAVTGGVILGVFDAFLVNMSWLGQVASLTHMINDLQIPADLFRRGQARLLRAFAELHVQIVLFGSDGHILVLGGQAIEVDPLVVDPIIVAGHMLEA